jgi:outer membrane receptor for ferrienterochelin and colicin
MNKFFLNSLLFATIALAVHAQHDSLKDSSDIYTLSLEELMNIKVTTATKAVGKVDAVPAVIEVFTRELIKERGYQTLAQILNDIQGNHEDRSNWGIGEPVNQNVGFGFRFDTGQNMLLLFNGQRLNAFLPGNRFGGEEYLLDNIERIEII